MKFSTVAGWLLAFLGGITLIIDAVVTVISSLSAHQFVWGAGQTTWAVVGAALIVVGGVVFVSSIFTMMKD